MLAGSALSPRPRWVCVGRSSCREFTAPGVGSRSCEPRGPWALSALTGLALRGFPCGLRRLTRLLPAAGTSCSPPRVPSAPRRSAGSVWVSAGLPGATDPPVQFARPAALAPRCRVALSGITFPLTRHTAWSPRRPRGQRRLCGLRVASGVLGGRRIPGEPVLSVSFPREAGVTAGLPGWHGVSPRQSRVTSWQVHLLLRADPALRRGHRAPCPSRTLPAISRLCRSPVVEPRLSGGLGVTPSMVPTASWVLSAGSREDLSGKPAWELRPSGGAVGSRGRVKQDAWRTRLGTGLAAEL